MNENIEFNLPILPKLKDYNPYGTFVCENCEITINEYDKDEKKFIRSYNTMFRTTSQQNLDRHKKTKKHIQNISVEGSRPCKKCNEVYSPKGLKLHIERNSRCLPIEDLQRPLCNTFIYKNKRFIDIDAVVKYKNDYDRYLYNKKNYVSDLRYIREGKGKRMIGSASTSKQKTEAILSLRDKNIKKKKDI